MAKTCSLEPTHPYTPIRQRSPPCPELEGNPRRLLRPLLQHQNLRQNKLPGEPYELPVQV